MVVTVKEQTKDLDASLFSLALVLRQAVKLCVGSAVFAQLPIGQQLPLSCAGTVLLACCRLQFIAVCTATL